MKKIIPLLLLFLLSACRSTTYIIVSDEPVDGYDILQKESKSVLCNSYWQDVYYSGEVYNYGYRFKSCSPEMTFFILVNDDYIYLHEALDRGLITLESLRPELNQLERDPEEISSDEADYYWLDFHIGSEVVYAYAGGECDQAGSETFIINQTTYAYSASGCLKENILFMRIDGENIPVATLIENNDIDPNLLIPLLEEQ